MIFMPDEYAKSINPEDCSPYGHKYDKRPGSKAGGASIALREIVVMNTRRSSTGFTAPPHAAPTIFHLDTSARTPPKLSMTSTISCCDGRTTAVAPVCSRAVILSGKVDPSPYT
jgi:hypothetical protein